jgi:two-component system, OmpR family, phosphate regulon sensor histidine kinase PhoR
VTVGESQSTIWRDLLDSARDGLLALDENGAISWANDAAATMLNRTRRHLIGKPFTALVPLDERRVFRRAVHDVLAGDLPVSTSLHLGGAERAAVVILTVSERSRPRRIIAALRSDGDTTPVARLVPGPRAISRELDAFFLRFPHAVVGVHRNLRIAFANPRAKAMLGADEMRLGRPFEDGLAEGQLRALAERLTTISAPLPATTIALRDGRVLRASGIAARRNDPAVLLLEDVTEETRSDRVTRDFVRNAAHQLRTPLTGITSAVQVLQSGAKENPVDRDRFLEHVERHTDRLTRIARGLLVLARAQAGDAMRLEFVELLPLIEELTDGVEVRASVELIVHCPQGLAAFCERDLMHEALGALVDNAIEHTPHGSISIGARESDGMVAIEVSDTGSGVLPEHRTRLFEPFYRPESSGDGFGLGLAIAAQAVEAMDGELSLVDADGGTTFRIRLPSARAVG